MNNYFKPMIIKIRSAYKDKIMQSFIALVSYYRVDLYNVYADNLITPVEQNVVLVMIRYKLAVRQTPVYIVIIYPSLFCRFNCYWGH